MTVTNRRPIPLLFKERADVCETHWLDRSYTHKHTQALLTLVSLLSFLLLRLYEMFRCSFDFLDPHCPLMTAELTFHYLIDWLIGGKCRCRSRTSRSKSPFLTYRRGRCARRERGARRWMGQGASSPKPHSETAAGDRKLRRLNPITAAFGMSAREIGPWCTVLYIFSCTLDLRLKSLSDPEEENCLALCVRRRKSLKRKAHSSLLLLVLCRRPLCSSLRGPRQLVSELKTKCWKRTRVRC